MDFINYGLILITSFLGLFTGIILSYIALEEILSVNKILKFLNIALITLIVFISLYPIANIIAFISASIILISLILLRNKEFDVITYPAMGIMLYVSTISGQILNTAVLIFIYGISLSGIESNKYFENKKDLHVTFKKILLVFQVALKKYAYYIVVSLIAYITFSYIL